MVAPEKNTSWACAPKVPTVSGVKEFRPTRPIALAEKTTKIEYGYCESAKSGQKFRCRLGAM